MKEIQRSEKVYEKTFLASLHPAPGFGEKMKFCFLVMQFL